MQSNPVLRDIVLLGGGHAHAVVIKKWGMKPIPGVRMTLISRDSLTPYSGMLPGLLAGHYSLTDAHIDLSRLCRWAHVRFIQADITGLDAKRKYISLDRRPPVAFDIVSLDTGSTPNLKSVAGAREHTVPVKPVHRFHDRWQSLLKRLEHQQSTLDIGVVGAGAGGFELLLAMQHRLNADNKTTQHRFHWIIRDKQILGSHNEKVRQRALRECVKKNIDIHWEFSVERVEQSRLLAEDGRSLSLDEIIWCTDAVGPRWLADSGLARDERGFLAVNQYLQSMTHDFIFAAGDVATQIDNPRPKAGVFAVRAGPILAENLNRYILDQKLKPYNPQGKFLSILATGGKSAIASKGRFCANGAWVWQWKDRIDTGFMDKFNDLPPVTPMPAKGIAQQLLKISDDNWSPEHMRCAGCGAKVSADTLSRVLGQLEIFQRDDQIYGLESPDDAAVIQTENNLLAQSVDQIRSMIDDPFVFAQIAAVHALSDLYAMGAKPQSAMAMIALPFATEEIYERDLNQIMQGVAKQLGLAECTLSGGHTNEAMELSLGLVVNGLVDLNHIKRNSELQPGDKLILTKPLGTGVILAADMQAKCTGPVLQKCIDNMLLSNREAAEIFQSYSATAVTDITGFGLIGHLLEMLRTSEKSCQLDVETIPLLPGASALSTKGIVSSLFSKNERMSSNLDQPDQWRSLDIYPLLFDPQTSGGLLAGVPASKAEACLAKLHTSGFPAAALIGEAKSFNSSSDCRIFRSDT